MSNTNAMNRRDWLKATALFTGGLSILPPALQHLQAAPVNKASHITNANHISDAKANGPLYSDARAAAQLPPDLKARLFANENPFGPSPNAKKAMMDSLEFGYQYPYMHVRDLEAKICAYEGIDPKMIVTSAGSSPLLLGIAVALCGRGGNVVSADPTYEDLPTRCENVNAHWIKVPLKADYTHDLDAMEKAITPDTKLVYICNPNNPTGTITDIAKLKDFCERVSKKVPVFVDEAYIDFLPNPDATTLIEGVKKGQNLIIARTFSKIYGLAGLRIGYVIAQPDMIDLLQKVASNGSYALSGPAISAALVSYQDKAFMQEVTKKMEASKNYLYEVLKGEGYTYIPSHTNFVMFPLKMDGERFVDEMAKRGVGLRNWKLNNQDWCRISIGRMDEMQAFAAAFKELS